MLFITAALCVSASVGFAGASVNPRPGAYSYRTFSFSISFKVSSNHKRITGLATNFEATTCAGNGSEKPVNKFPALQIRKGRFHGSVVKRRGATEHVHVTGTFTAPDHVNGTIADRVTFRKNALPPCKASATFTASRIASG